MMGRAGRPQFDDHAVAVIMTQEPKKNFYKKFLHSPFPVESSLHCNLHIHLSAEVSMGTLSSLSDCVEWLSWTYFFRRLAYNPSYYGLIDHSNHGIRVFVIKLLVGVLVDLETCGALRLVIDDAEPIPSAMKKGTEAHHSLRSCVLYLRYNRINITRKTKLGQSSAQNALQRLQL